MTLRTDRRGCVQCGEALTDLAEALGRVRADDGAPYVMTWDEVVAHVSALLVDLDELERERDEAMAKLLRLDDQLDDLFGVALGAEDRAERAERDRDAARREAELWRDRYHAACCSLSPKPPLPWERKGGDGD